jgi:acyl-CoA thioesterase FadM
MKPSESALIPVNQQLRPKGFRQNTMAFPQDLREAIPTMRGCWGRALALASIDGDCRNSALFGQQVRIRFQVEETGKLSGKFDVQAYLNLDAARALAKTLTDLVEQAERMPQSVP